MNPETAHAKLKELTAHINNAVALALAQQPDLVNESLEEIDYCMYSLSAMFGIGETGVEIRIDN